MVHDIKILQRLHLMNLKLILNLMLPLFSFLCVLKCPIEGPDRVAEFIHLAEWMVKFQFIAIYYEYQMYLSAGQLFIGNYFEFDSDREQSSRLRIQLVGCQGRQRFVACSTSFLVQNSTQKGPGNPKDVKSWIVINSLRLKVLWKTSIIFCDFKSCLVCFG